MTHDKKKDSETSYPHYSYSTAEGDQLSTLTKPIKGLQPKPIYIRALLASPVLTITLPVLFALVSFWIIKARLFPTGTLPDAIFAKKGTVVVKNSAVQSRASTTAQAATAYRYTATLCKFCDDPLARFFMTPDFIVFAVMFSIFVSVRSGFQPFFVACRTVAMDTFVLQAQPKQVIVLGAGHDSRAHRLPLSNAQFFEVDIATTQSFKLDIIHAHPTQFTNMKVEYAAVDFSKETAFEVLKRNSKFNPNESNTVILLEGLSYYLSFDEFIKTLQDVRSNLPRGIRIMFDCFEDVWSTKKNLAKDRGAAVKSFVNFVAATGEPFQFGLATHQTALDTFEPLGFKVLAHFGPHEIQQRFGGGGRNTNAAAHFIILKT